MSAHCPDVTPGPTINLSLTTLSEMSQVRVTPGHQSPDVHICCGAHSADITVIPALIYCHRSKGWCSNITLMVLRILFTTYLLCANFYIFPICSNRDNSMRLGNVSCHQLSSVVIGPGWGRTTGTTQHPLINWSRPGLRGAEKSEKTEQIKHQCLSSSQFFVSKHSNGRIQHNTNRPVLK